MNQFIKYAIVSAVSLWLTQKVVDKIDDAMTKKK